MGRLRVRCREHPRGAGQVTQGRRAENGTVQASIWAMLATQHIWDQGFANAKTHRSQPRSRAFAQSQALELPPTDTLRIISAIIATVLAATLIAQAAPDQELASLNQPGSAQSQTEAAVSPDQFQPFGTQDSDKDAAKSLRLRYDSRLAIKWSQSTNGTLVEVKLPYRNIGDRPIRCEILLASGTTTEPDEEAEYPNWRACDARKVVFTLAPGEERLVTQALHCCETGDDKARPTLRFARPRLLGADADLVKCTFATARDSLAAR